MMPAQAVPWFPVGLPSGVSVEAFHDCGCHRDVRRAPGDLPRARDVGPLQAPLLGEHRIARPELGHRRQAPVDVARRRQERNRLELDQVRAAAGAAGLRRERRRGGAGHLDRRAAGRDARIDDRQRHVAGESAGARGVHRHRRVERGHPADAVERGLLDVEPRRIDREDSGLALVALERQRHPLDQVTGLELLHCVGRHRLSAAALHPRQTVGLVDPGLGRLRLGLQGRQLHAGRVKQPGPVLRRRVRPPPHGEVAADALALARHRMDETLEHRALSRLRRHGAPPRM